ncbi:MAG: zf-HC2 domain-containing protein [Planctomycetota bacterium]|jgi:hypothetical protein
MNCRNIQSLLTLYASGDLGFREAVRMREHLQKCPDCALALERERDVLKTLNDAGKDRKAPQGVLDDITAGVMNRLDEKSAVPLALYHRAPSWGRAKAVAALAALVIIAVLLVIAVMPEQSEVIEQEELKPGKADRNIANVTPFERLPNEEQLRPAEVRVPKWRYRRNWREKTETPDGGVRVIPTGGSRF